MQRKCFSLESNQLLRVHPITVCISVPTTSLLPATLWHHISILGARFRGRVLQTWCHSSLKLTSWQAVFQLRTHCTGVCQCVDTIRTISHPAAGWANRKAFSDLLTVLSQTRLPDQHQLACLSFQAPLAKPVGSGAKHWDGIEPEVSHAVKTSGECKRASEVSTFVRVHHALQHGYWVVRLKLQRDVPHSLHQVREEVCHLLAVLQQNVAVLSVGEVRVAQVGAGGKKKKQEMIDDSS